MNNATKTTCPAWCDRDGCDSDPRHRTHTTTVAESGNMSAVLEQFVHWPHGQVVTASPTATVRVGIEYLDDLTVEDCRRLAAVALAAAEALESAVSA